MTALLLALLGCKPGSDDVLLVVAESHADRVADLVDVLPEDRVAVVAAADPASAADAERGLRVAVIDDPALCDGCYTLTAASKDVLEARGGGVLGVQYAASAALEHLGARFFHPQAARVPERFGPIDPDGADLGEHAPEMARRGLHMHTLHPIEGMYDFWEGDGDISRAKQVVDWVVANRGNHLQWVGLDDITDDPERHAQWVEHTAAIVDYAHDHGLTTGLGVQLFGSGNLQNAFDLVDGNPDEAGMIASIDERMRLVVQDTPFDLINLSFGEFFGEDPEDFVAAANLAYDGMQAVAPGIEVTTVIHVGNFDDLRVEYQGEEVLYYFLVKFADPAMVPWVHTVMYYNLYEDAGLAYLHDEFDEHRQFLLDRLAAGEPVGYFPESAYWVAFDIHVPTYLPLYIRSRHLDMEETRARVEADGMSPLDDHVLFSSGWEWGYWQTDALTLRMNYELGDGGYEAHVRDLFATYGDAGDVAASVVIDLAELEHRYLLEDRLAAYLASREAVIEVGDDLGIVSQPDRPDLEEVAAYDAATADAFRADVLDGLHALANGTRALRARAAVAGLPDDRFVRELRDGLDITALRADYARAIFAAALAHGQGEDAEAWIAAAEEGFAAARAVVDRRHGDLHDPDGTRLIVEGDNPTIYDYGYLTRGETLCFWERELGQVKQLVRGTTESIPACAP